MRMKINQEGEIVFWGALYSMMNKFLAEDLEVMAGVDSFCYQNCLRIVMKLQAIEYPELYLNATLSVKYDLHERMLRPGTNIRTLFPEESRYVHRVTYEEEVDPMVIFRENIKYIQDHDSPMIVGVDTFYLPYASNVGKNHAKHTAILCGWDEKSQKVYLIDWYPPWFFKGSVDLKDFLLARSSKNEDAGSIYSGNKIGNNWAVIEGIQPKSKDYLLHELLDSMRREYYRDADDYYLYGPEAITAMKGVIDECLSKEQFHSLHREIWFIGKRYRLFSGFLQNYRDSDLYETVEKILDCVDKEADEWDRMLMLSTKGCIAPTDRVREKFKNRIDNLLHYDQELQVFFCNLEKQIDNKKRG